MATTLLTVHSLLRWVFIILAVLVLVRAYRGWLSNQTYTDMDHKMGSYFILAMHLQVMIGFILYFVLGYQNRFSKMAETMKDGVERFWTVEHLSMMLIAAIILTIGRVKSKKSDTDLAKHKKAAIFYTIGILVVLMAIPWPFREEIGRMWFRGF